VSRARWTRLDAIEGSSAARTGFRSAGPTRAIDPRSPLRESASQRPPLPPCDPDSCSAIAVRAAVLEEPRRGGDVQRVVGIRTPGTTRARSNTSTTRGEEFEAGLEPSAPPVPGTMPRLSWSGTAPRVVGREFAQPTAYNSTSALQQGVYKAPGAAIHLLGGECDKCDTRPDSSRPFCRQSAPADLRRDRRAAREPGPGPGKKIPVGLGAVTQAVRVRRRGNRVRGPRAAGRGRADRDPRTAPNPDRASPPEVVGMGRTRRRRRRSRPCGGQSRRNFPTEEYCRCRT